MKRFIEIGLMSFNQENALKKTISNLEEVMNHPRNIEFDVNFCISDNASTDNSWEQILSFQDKYPAKIRINRHTTNTLFHGNYLSLIKSQQAEFGLILGCGDTLNPDKFFWFLDQLYDAVYNKKMKIAMCVLGEDLPAQDDNCKLIFSDTPIRISEAVACNVYNLTKVNSICFQSEAAKIWPHLQLGLDIIDMNPDSLYCDVKSKIISLDRPNHGWYTSPNFFKILLLRDVILFSERSNRLKLSVNYFMLKDQGKEIASLIYRNRLLTDFKINRRLLFEMFICFWKKPVSLFYILILYKFPVSIIKLCSKCFNLWLHRKQGCNSVNK